MNTREYVRDHNSGLKKHNLDETQRACVLCNSLLISYKKVVEKIIKLKF